MGKCPAGCKSDCAYLDEEEEYTEKYRSVEFFAYGYDEDNPYDEEDKRTVTLPTMLNIRLSNAQAERLAEQLRAAAAYADSCRSGDDPPASFELELHGFSKKPKISKESLDEQHARNEQGSFVKIVHFDD